MAAIDLDKTNLLDPKLFKAELATSNLYFKEEEFYEGSNSNPYFLFLMHEVIRSGDQGIFNRLVTEDFYFSRLHADNFTHKGRGMVTQASPPGWEPSQLQLSVALINARISGLPNRNNYGLHWSFLVTTIDDLKGLELEAFQNSDDCEYYLMAVTYLIRRLPLSSNVPFRSDLMFLLINSILDTRKCPPLDKLSLALGMAPPEEPWDFLVEIDKPTFNSKWFSDALQVIEKYPIEDILKFKNASIGFEEIDIVNNLGVISIEDVIEVVRDTPKLWLQKMNG